MSREPIRLWRSGRFQLDLFDTGWRDWRGQTRLAYTFTDGGRIIFEGQDFCGSPLHADDSDQTVAALLSFLSLRPGDTDREYFDRYTPEQLAWAEQNGEELSLLAEERSSWELAPRIRITYEIVTPESAEQGDAADRGWHDEEGVEMDWPFVDEAVRFLRQHGASEGSSSHFHPGVWYIGQSEQNYRTGAEKTLSFHLVGFRTDEEQEIFRRLTNRAQAMAEPGEAP